MTVAEEALVSGLIESYHEAHLTLFCGPPHEQGSTEYEERQRRLIEITDLAKALA